MAIVPLWAGNISGTNTGRLFLNLEGDDSELSGNLRLNDDNFGLCQYTIVGSFKDGHLVITGDPLTSREGLAFGKLSASATLNAKGNLEGVWETDIGSAGTFILFPHDQSWATGPDSQKADQLHTARHHLGAIEINREQIISLAEDIQKDFSQAKVVITVVADSEQSHFLENFKTLNFMAKTAKIAKIFIQEPEGGGTNRVVSVEFGPLVNEVITQGANEAWVLGKLQKLKNELRHFERSYTTNFKRFGLGFNQLLLVAAIVYLPSLANLLARSYLMAGILVLILAINWLHGRYLPFATIYLGKKPKGLRALIAPSVLSWLIAITAGVVATLLAGYLEGWLEELISRLLA